jgi:hypothetical protein
VTGSTWRTGSPPPPRQRVTRPSLSQVLRQVVVIALICAGWAIVFAGYLRLAGESTDSTAPAIAVATPAQTPTALATATPHPPTATQTSAVEPTANTVTGMGTATPESSPLPGETPTPEPMATTAVPPRTDTPEPAPTATTAPPTETAPPTPVDSDEVSFSGNVLPIFQNRCVKCHGGEKTEEGLVLSSYADVMAGSFNGPVVVPGNVPDSYLVEQVVSGEMPKRGPRLLPAEVRFIADWVNSGAPDN